MSHEPNMSYQRKEKQENNFNRNNFPSYSVSSSNRLGEFLGMEVFR
jgi:hypothetical protein